MGSTNVLESSQHTGQKIIRDVTGERRLSSQTLQRQQPVVARAGVLM
jgi:hypothetical protein